MAYSAYHGGDNLLDVADLVDSDSEGPFFTIDTDQSPFVKVVIARTPDDNSELDRFQREFIDLLKNAQARGIKLAILFNVDGIVKATMNQKIYAARFIGDVRVYALVAIQATGLVVTNTMARVILQAILALKPLAAPNQVFDNEDAAEQWLRAVLSRSAV